MYLFGFIKHYYGIITFADIMLGETIDNASKKLSPLYDDVEEKFSRLIPSIKGKLIRFEDKYMMYPHIEIIGNPITSIEVRAHFDHFPYSTISGLYGMEDRFAEEKNMELITKPEWKDNTPGALHQIERRVHMCNLLYDYYSYTGISDSGYTMIGVKLAFPKHNLNVALQDTVMGTYNQINNLLRNYQRNLELLNSKYKDKNYYHST